MQILRTWAAANGGVTNGGLRGVWPPFPEIGRNRPFSPFFRPFPEGAKSTWEIQKTEEKGLFPQISSDLLKPPSLKPPFAALQRTVDDLRFRVCCVLGCSLFPSDFRSSLARQQKAPKNRNNFVRLFWCLCYKVCLDRVFFKRISSEN